MATLDTLLLATRNPGKLAELRALLAPAGVRVVAPDEVGWVEEVPEEAQTLEENALGKARAASAATGLAAVADDTGLFVDALGGAPGVRSARYAGEAQDPRANCAKLLAALEGVPEAQRGAEFCSAVALVAGGREIVFWGLVRGRIAPVPRGTGGFGYDPLFELPELGRTFAELTSGEKNRWSHRGKALTGLRDYLVSARAERGIS